MTTIQESYESACLRGGFYKDAYGHYKDRLNFRGPYIIDGYYIVFVAYDGYHVKAAVESKEEAEKIVETLNGLGSVEACDKFFASLRA